MDNRKGHPPRLRGWDYSSHGAYFVTFNVKENLCHLSFFEEKKLTLTESGCIVQQCWERLPSDFPRVELVELMIMPNHVHSIIQLNSPKSVDNKSEHVQVWPLMNDHRLVLSKIVRAWKARSTKLIRENCLIDFAWQTRFYERIIRNENELERIMGYMRTNPERWLAKQEQNS